MKYSYITDSTILYCFVIKDLYEVQYWLASAICFDQLLKNTDN